ncbi:MAG: phosphoenolpyruvate carboxykinase (ATP), partial [Armatimonadota bacterium]|nr:phosphoenolpyruvate carboxykinase (ATP) [Armatimonadota bacterium]
GKYTGRSPKDKFLVDDGETHSRVDWGKTNQPLPPEKFDALLREMMAFAAGRELFVFEGFAGADLASRLPIRIITQYAWHSLFAHQLFVRPTPAELTNFEPHFTLIDLPAFQADPSRNGVRSETVIALDLTRKMGLICGTEYAGEIKKSVFTVLNYLLPQRGIFPMHCSANAGPDGDSALFFGLSGTGKTTLSADPERRLIGDDEHGWSDTGVFNFEGGCYAKCVRLSAFGEPEIWNAIGFGTVLENVVLDTTTRVADYNDISLTENTRAAYPITHIPNALIPGIGGHPKTILFLTADAFGVLPPISRLTREQALYHFLSGYTSKLAGTERGVTEPEPNFSACFGAPFWPLPPTEYAEMLGRRLDAHNATCYLVNTGWSGGPYGIGQRINLDQTRAMVHAALRGDLQDAPTVTDPVFGLHIPQRVPGVPDNILQPRATWTDAEAYDAAAQALAARFRANFERFPQVSETIKVAGPQRA